MLRILLISKKNMTMIKNIAKYKRERLEGKFVSSNAISLSRRNLTQAEILLLSKGLKFVPTASKIDSNIKSGFRRVWEKTLAYLAF